MEVGSKYMWVLLGREWKDGMGWDSLNKHYHDRKNCVGEKEKKTRIGKWKTESKKRKKDVKKKKTIGKRTWRIKEKQNYPKTQ